MKKAKTIFLGLASTILLLSVPVSATQTVIYDGVWGIAGDDTELGDFYGKDDNGIFIGYFEYEGNYFPFYTVYNEDEECYQGVIIIYGVVKPITMYIYPVPCFCVPPRFEGTWHTDDAEGWMKGVILE